MSHYSVAVIVPAYVYEGHNFLEEGIEVAEALTNDYVERAMEPYNESPEQGSEYLEEEDRTGEIIESYLEDTITEYKKDGVVISREDAVVEREATREEADIIKKTNSVDGLNIRVNSYRHWANSYILCILKDGVEKENIRICERTPFWNYAEDNWGIHTLIECEKNRSVNTGKNSYVQVFNNRSVVLNTWNASDSNEHIRDILKENLFVFTFYNPNARWDYWRIINGRDSETGEVHGIIPTKDNRMVPSCPISEMSLEYEWNEEKEKNCRAFWEIATKQREATPEEKKSNKYFVYYKPEYYKQFYGTYEKFRTETKSFRTHAIVTEKDGWVEPGTVGWFASCDETPESRDLFIDKFKEIINNANPNDVIVGVDCHI